MSALKPMMLWCKLAAWMHRQVHVACRLSLQQSGTGVHVLEARCCSPGDLSCSSKASAIYITFRQPSAC